MKKWFECTVAYEKNEGSGKVARISEKYLVDALSYTEAEARIIKEMEEYLGGDFEVKNIRRMHIAEMFSNDTGDRWYRCKVAFISLDENKGTEKRTAVAMLVLAETLKEACNNLIEGLKDCLADYEIVTISETGILDVFEYKGE